MTTTTQQRNSNSELGQQAARTAPACPDSKPTRRENTAAAVSACVLFASLFLAVGCGGNSKAVTVTPPPQLHCSVP